MCPFCPGGGWVVCGVRFVFVSGVLDALPGEVGEGGVEFDAEPVALVFFGHDGGGAGSEEGVQYDAGFAVWVGVGCVVCGGAVTGWCQGQAEGFGPQTTGGAGEGCAAGAAASFGAAGEQHAFDEVCWVGGEVGASVVGCCQVPDVAGVLAEWVADGLLAFHGGEAFVAVGVGAAPVFRHSSFRWV